MSRNPLVIYHGGCRDGFCAAWVCHHALLSSGKSPEFFEGRYGEAPPKVDDLDVVMVDFSYPLVDMQRIAAGARSLLVLDHHKTAQEALAAFSAPNATVVFDMDRSGAGLALDHYFPGARGEGLWWPVRYVEDRDLWRNALPSSGEVNAYLGALPFGFYDWDHAAEHGLEHAMEAGKAIRMKLFQYITEVRKNAENVVFEGYRVPIVNAPQVDISELVGALAVDVPFAMGWWRGHGVFNYSLRSRGGVDVSELAKRHGGGGHRNAAGFQSKKLILPEES